jgi:DNA-binding CsgD family transcriptional regulator
MVIRRLLKRFGWIRAPATHKYEVDDAFHPVLISLAEQQQSSPDKMVSDLLNEALSHRQLDADLANRWQSLSPREQQIAALTCLGYTNPQIATRLGLAVETVRTHTRNVQIKFNVNSKADLRLLLSAWDFSSFDQM